MPVDPGKEKPRAGEPGGAEIFDEEEAA